MSIQHFFCRNRVILSLRGKIGELVSSRNGAAALIFALVFPVMIAAIGVAIDYANAAKIRTQVNAAADIATLSATSHVSITNSTVNGTSTDNIRSAFDAQMAGFPNIQITSFNATVKKTINSVTATVDCTATVKNSFSQILHVDVSTIHCHSQSTVNLPAYVDFYLLLDNSPSMGVAATPTDLLTMMNATPDQCGFACHEKTKTGGEVLTDYYHVAKKYGVTMKIDTVRLATQQLTTTASSPTYELLPNQYRMGVYTFSDTFQTIMNLSSNLSSVNTASQAIDLAYAYYNQSDNQTSYDMALPKINTIMTAPGDGSTATAPKKFLFLVTDGVEDETASLYGKTANTGSRIIDTMTTSNCTAIKNRGIQIAVLYTVYLNLPTNSFYNTYVAPLNAQTGSNKIVNALTSCASPGFFFSVTPTQGIAEAMDAMFKAAISASRLSQ